MARSANAAIFLGSACVSVPHVKLPQDKYGNTGSTG